MRSRIVWASSNYSPTLKAAFFPYETLFFHLETLFIYKIFENSFLIYNLYSYQINYEIILTSN